MYLLFYVTSNGISVIFVTVQMCRRTEEEIYNWLGENYYIASCPGV